MKIPVILTASSAAEQASATYLALENHIRGALPVSHTNQYEFHWSYSSRVANRERAKGSTSSLPEIGDVVRQLIDMGHKHAIMQSLQLIVGHEFHQLHRESSHTEQLACHLGKPLLTAPDDFYEFIKILTTIASPYPDHALLLVGHGTRHASWPIYLGLEQVMQRHFGKRAYVGVVEHYPDSADIEQRMTLSGHSKVLVIPFFMVAGVHFHRDVAGEGMSSWRSRMLRAGLEVEIACSDGLGALPDIGRIFARHITDASAEIA